MGNYILRCCQWPDGLTSVCLNGTDIYVAGGAVVSALQLTDLLCIKYNSSGTQQWVNTWNNSSYNYQEGAVRLFIKASAVRVIGASQVGLSPVSWRLISADYNLSTGSGGASISIGLSNATFSEVKDVAIDDSNNIYVCGTTIVSGQQKNIHVVKYNHNLAEVWSYTKNGTASTDDEGVGLELSGTDVFISGYTSITSQGRNVYAAKLAQSNGAVSWEINNNLAGGDDEATGLQMDGNNNLIIPCVVDRNSTKDIGLLKLNHSTGVVITSSFYNSEINRDDYARDIAVNHTNNDVYVSAQVQVNDSTYESRIIKWKQHKVYNPTPTDAYSSYGGYILNRGQLRATDSTSNAKVMFYNQSNAIATYIDEDKISYQLVLANDTTNADTTYRVDMAFTAGKAAKVFAYTERSEYHNYYLGHMAKASIRTPISNVIIRPDVYDNTDVLYTSSPTGFRHWFVAKTGATPTSYQMSFTGQTGLSLDSLGNLIIATTIGDITYQQAKAYSMNTTTGVLTLLGWQPDYSITGSVVSFTSIGAWSGVLVLEVDEKTAAYFMPPYSNRNINWSTHFGDLYEQRNRDVASNSMGEVWYTGWTHTGIFIENPGQNVGDVLGSTDMYVAHFDELCRAQWATLCGGSSEDFATGIAIDEEGNSYCTGWVYSHDIPNTSLNGINYGMPTSSQLAGYFLKLNLDGEIDVDSHIAGGNNSAAFDIAYRPAGGGLDAAVFIVGSMSDTPYFPFVNSGSAFGYDQDDQNAIVGGGGYLMELNSDCEIVWSTLFSGYGDNSLFSVESVGGLPTVMGAIGEWDVSSYSEDDCSVPTDFGFPNCAPNGSWQLPPFDYSGKYFIARFGPERNLMYSTFLAPQGYVGDFMFESTWAKISCSPSQRAYNPSAEVDFYVSGGTEAEHAEDFPFTPWPTEYTNAYYKTFSDSDEGTFAWISKFQGTNEGVYLVGNTALRWDDNVNNLTIAADEAGGVIVAGSGIISELQDMADYCTNPINDEFPICDNDAECYFENNTTTYGNRSFIVHFNEEMAIDWSTLFGRFSPNAIICASTAGEYCFVGGYSGNIYSYWDYDFYSSEDYYRNTYSGIDATITRFEMPVQPIIVGNEEEHTSENNKLVLYPNPTLGQLQIALTDKVRTNDKIEVYDVHGKLVLYQPVRKETNVITLNVDKLSAGIYFLRYNGADSTYRESFIKE